MGAAVQLGVGPQARYRGAPVVCITGDAGIGYSVMELEALSKYRIPAIIIVYNNDAWGVTSENYNHQVRKDERAERELGGRLVVAENFARPIERRAGQRQSEA